MRGKIAWLGLALTALALLLGMLAVRAPRASAAEGQCFAETGKCVGPLFWQYWQGNGGLALNGYPLSDERVEILEDGQPYTVQYFERVRMEYHPENPDTSTVLLGQFGRRIHPADPAVPASGDGTYYQETGHNIGGTFLAYWRGHGGLAQFGYPLTELFSEKLEDGSTYQVQYFERARFELHPENAAPYDVLLGQFGRRILGESAGRVVTAACTAANLRPDLVSMGTAGSREGAVQLMNLSGAPCTLSGSPKVAVTDNGAPLDVTITEAASQDGVGTVGVGRGQAIKVPVRWSNYCGPQPHRVFIELTLPDGTVVRAPGASVPPCLGETLPSTLSHGPFSIGGQEQAAANVVLGFYGAINARDYQAAYALLGAQPRAGQSYDDFADGYATTANVLVSSIVAGGSATPGVYTIGVTLSAEQSDKSLKTYSGSYTVGPEGGALKITGADITEKPYLDVGLAWSSRRGAFAFGDRHRALVAGRVGANGSCRVGEPT